MLEETSSFPHLSGESMSWEFLQFLPQKILLSFSTQTPSKPPVLPLFPELGSPCRLWKTEHCQHFISVCCGLFEESGPNVSLRNHTGEQISSNFELLCAWLLEFSELRSKGDLIQEKHLKAWHLRAVQHFLYFFSKTSKPIHFIKWGFATFYSMIFQETAFAVVIQQPRPFARILTTLLLPASCHVFLLCSLHKTSLLQEDCNTFIVITSSNH